MGLEREQVAATTPSGLSFPQFIQKVAEEAKLNISIKGPDMVVVPWTFSDNRQQNTFVRPLGQTGNGHLIIGFFSPVKKVVTGNEVSPQTALDLLRKNARMPHGAWCIASVHGEEYLGVCDTQIAQTMQPEEFCASSLAIAKIADDMEKTFGTDAF